MRWPVRSSTRPERRWRRASRRTVGSRTAPCGRRIAAGFGAIQYAIGNQISGAQILVHNRLIWHYSVVYLTLAALAAGRPSLLSTQKVKPVPYSDLSIPPFDAAPGSVAVWTFMIANIVAASIALVLALMWVVRHRDAMPVYCMIGGFLAMLANEPILDRLMLVWYPSNTPLIMLDLYGTHMPLYLMIGYPWYVGLGAFVVHRALLNGITAAGLWRIFAVIAILDVIIELPSTIAGVHIYFGPQPNFFQHGLAVTIPFVMSAVSLACGFAVHWVLSSPKSAWAPLAVIAIIPGTAVGTLVATQWPVMLAQNSTTAPLVVWLTALISIVLVLAAMRAAISAVVVARDHGASRRADEDLSAAALSR